MILFRRKVSLASKGFVFFCLSVFSCRVSAGFASSAATFVSFIFSFMALNSGTAASGCSQDHRQGVQVHDARLAAVMKVYGVTRLLTFEKGNFTRFQGITVVAPSDV